MLRQISGKISSGCISMMTAKPGSIFDFWLPVIQANFEFVLYNLNAGCLPTTQPILNVVVAQEERTPKLQSKHHQWDSRTVIFFCLLCFCFFLFLTDLITTELEMRSNSPFRCCIYHAESIGFSKLAQVSQHN